MWGMKRLYSPHGIGLGDEWYLSVWTPEGSLLLLATNRVTVHCITCGKKISPTEGIRFEDRPYKSGFLCRPDARNFIDAHGADGYRANIRGGLEVGNQTGSFPWFRSAQVSGALYMISFGEAVLAP